MTTKMNVQDDPRWIDAGPPFEVTIVGQREPMTPEQEVTIKAMLNNAFCESRRLNREHERRKAARN